MPGTELEAGQAFVDLKPRLERGFGGAVERELDGPISRMKSKGAAIGKVLMLGVGAGVVGGGALLLGAAKTLDDSFDTIETGTGAVGDKLEGLKQNFRNVAKDSSSDMADVATAVTEVYKRTGLTGTGLEKLAAQEATLARITGTDLAGNIKSTTRLFGDWNVATDKQSGTLDYLFKVSQATGVTVADLSDGLVKYGAPLRQLGFGLEDSAALLGKFEKEGVNTGLVLGSMRVALGKMAKAGEDPKETLARVTEEIKNAGSAGEANAKAIELFGARAGPDMAAAIREGRFEVGDLVKDLKSSGNTIEGTAAKTDDFSEKFTKLKNRAILAAEPLAGKLMDAINALADRAEPVVKWIGDRMPAAFDKLEGAISPIVAGIRTLLGIIFSGDFEGGGPFAEDSPWVDGAFRLRELFLEKILPAAKEFFGWISEHGKPIMLGLAVALGLILAPFLTIGAALFAAYVRFEGFRNVVDGVAHWLVTNVPPLFEALRAGIAVAFDWLRTNLPPIIEAIRLAIVTAWAWISENVLPIIDVIVSTIVGAWDSVVAWFRENWPQIQGAISVVLDGIRTYIETWVSYVKFLWKTFGDEILGILVTAWDFIRSTVENAINLVRSIIETVLALINGDWGKAWDGIKGILSALWDQIVNIISTAGKLAVDALEVVLSALRAAWDLAWDGMKAVLGGLWDGLTGGAKFALNAFLSLLEKAINFGVDLINTALDGIDKAAGPLVNFGEVPNVTLPKLAEGGTSKRTGLAIVGDGGNGSGSEIMALPRGASVVPLAVGRMIAAAALEGAGAGRSGMVLEAGAIQVDARGIEDPAAVGDLTARHIGWRTNQESSR